VGVLASQRWTLLSARANVVRSATGRPAKVHLTPPAAVFARTHRKKGSPVPAISLVSLLQLAIGLGLLWVWLVRAPRKTAFRGGDSRSLKEEFAVYGLPPSAFYIVGTLKVAAAVALIAGLWFPILVLPAAAVIAVLMLGAVAMHFKVHDPLIKVVPAALLLLLSVGCSGLVAT
jgi:uncharacterized membrane protein YphA (DoxX/SURF4 family)